MNLMLVRPRRWFLYCAASLFALLFVSIMLAGLLLLRQGLVVREGQVMGNSMEPHFHGPRWQWTCPNCLEAQQSCVDTTHFGKPIRCQSCKEVTSPLTESVASAIEESAVKIDGQRVRIAPLRAVRSLRLSDKGMSDKGQNENKNLHPSGLRRGDVVVLRPSPDRPKEIKRLVGFPNERISIRDGDLFVDQKRWEKSMEESMRQAIVVDSHTKPLQLVSEITESKDTHEWSWQRPILNDLPLNQHDSHQLRVVSDVGIAIQLAGSLATFNLDIMVKSKTSDPMLDSIVASVEFDEGRAKASLEGKTVDIPMKESTDLDGWIVLIGFDKNWMLGDGQREWIRIQRREREPPHEDLAGSIAPTVYHHSGEPTRLSNDTSFRLNCRSGRLQMDRILILRDIMWLGAQDRSEQDWDASDGCVFLGDNVSSSSDSRDRWEVRPKETIIKWLVLEPENPIENLLRQQIGF